MKGKVCIAISAVTIIIPLVICVVLVYRIDPFFHYHAPYTDDYYYVIDNERSMNDGISRNFSYDAIITGTSMAENIRTSEVDELFDVHSIKVPFSGATFKEIRNLIDRANSSDNQIKLIICSLDTTSFIRNRDEMRFDLGEYPTYLYNNTILDDAKYLLNKEIIINRAYEMYKDSRLKTKQPGITSFDEYANWMKAKSPNDFGKNNVLSEYQDVYADVGKNATAVHLTEKQVATIKDNIGQNILEMLDNYSDVEFYYYIPPYSAAFWKGVAADGDIFAEIEARKIVIELLLTRDNVRLFSYDDLTEITTDLNNYCDCRHYGEWINSLIVLNMSQGIGEVTKDNYLRYLDDLKEIYLTYDYSTLDSQKDYECDQYQAAIFKNLKGCGVENICMDGYLDNTDNSIGDVSVNEPNVFKAELKMNKTLSYNANYDNRLIDACVINLEDAQFDYLFFDAKRIDDGNMYVALYNGNDVIEACDESYEDFAWHQFSVNLSEYYGPITIIISSDKPQSDNEESYVFKNIELR